MGGKGYAGARAKHAVTVIAEQGPPLKLSYIAGDSESVLVFKLLGWNPSLRTEPEGLSGAARKVYSSRRSLLVASSRSAQMQARFLHSCVGLGLPALSASSRSCQCSPVSASAYLAVLPRLPRGTELAASVSCTRLVPVTVLAVCHHDGVTYHSEYMSGESYEVSETTSVSSVSE